MLFLHDIVMIVFDYSALLWKMKRLQYLKEKVCSVERERERENDVFPYSSPDHIHYYGTPATLALFFGQAVYSFEGIGMVSFSQSFEAIYK